MTSLAQYPPEQQLNMVGERLFSQISKSQPDLAGKITGMLLERYSSSIHELVDIVNSETELSNNIEQAMEVLNKFAKEQSAGGDKEEN